MNSFIISNYHDNWNLSLRGVTGKGWGKRAGESLFDPTPHTVQSDTFVNESEILGMRQLSTLHDILET